MNNVLEYLENIDINNTNGIRDIKHFISYQDLKEDSKKIGSFLAAKVSPRSPIPIYMEKEASCVSLFMGSLYAGCFYTLLNTSLPAKRLNDILQVLESNFILTDYEHLETAHTYFPNKTIYCYEDMVKSEIDSSLLKTRREASLSIDPVYANFTSGSTGVPKGVLISHDNIISFIDTFTSTFQITENDCLGNQAPFDFDVSVKDIYSALKTGAMLVIVPKEYFSQPALLLDYLDDYKVTTLIWAVSALCLLSSFHGLDYKKPKNINKIFFSGEIMPIKHLNNWLEAYPQAQFVNLYGPTEITCNCTYYIIDNHQKYDVIPVGKAFLNHQVFLLDNNNLEITAPDIKGEIIVKSKTVALGYYNDLVKTKAAFIQNPLNNKYLDIVYKTGDLGYYHDGNLYFAGRSDFQIKYMGHRIELEEIDKNITNMTNVIRSTTIFIPDKEKLVCFYVGSIDKKELYTNLKKELPIFMVPTKYYKLDNMPLTKNGKVDRKELKRLYVTNL